MTHEILDLVNESDIVIGQVSREQAWAERLPIRVVNAFVVNSLGKLWIPRRVASKSTFPNCLDVSVGGHVQTGESYFEAFKRETSEEIKVNLEAVWWREVAYFSPFSTSLSAFMRVYLIQLEVVELNQQEFSESFWFSPRELIARIKNGELAKGDLLELVTRVFEVNNEPT
jgi:isopentenyldiphosphate isomerase